MGDGWDERGEIEAAGDVVDAVGGWVGVGGLTAMKKTKQKKGGSHVPLTRPAASG